ncbi:hypothetical protein NQ315_006316 [Exocentrus adspersus]|uniref:Zinc carboxypeptidase A 1 n=1 Tax=Exocentrus adspersus TaxID=1586481 RepID=A0AAV8VZE8_9CUCU|nr:hypothetical protein NQ315_006316 [Exocentrus adspersus]
MKLLILFILSVCSVGEKIRYDGFKLYKITPTTRQAADALHDLELAENPDFNFWNPVRQVGKPVNVMVPPYQTSYLETMASSLGMDFNVVMEDVQKQIDLQQPATRATNDSFGWTRYHTLDEINDWLRNISTRFPEIVTFIEAEGKSYEGRSIYGIRISYSPDNVNNSVFLESNIHSNEWITSAVSTYIVNELLTSSDVTVRQVAESHDWYFFPVFNPDGFVYAHTADRLWRKTRVPHSILCLGADPNRNWAHSWNSIGTSNSPCSEIYSGPEPFSEPMCRSMSQFISTVAESLVGYISFHSYSQLLLLPYGHTGEHLENYQQMYDIGLKAVDALAARYGTHYYVGTIYETIYPASGTSADWVKGTFHTPIVYSYELRDRGEYGFLLPPEQILPTAEETLDSFVTIFIEYQNSLNNTG